MLKFNEELVKIEEKRNLLTKMNNKLKNINKQIYKETNKLTALEEQLAKEKADVSKLESTFSINAILVKMSGTYQEDLTREKREFYEAQAKVLEARDYLEQLQETQRKITADIEQMKNIDKEYTQVLEMKKEYLMQFDNENTAKITAFMDEVNAKKLELKEIEEAYVEGEILLPLVSNLIASLQSVKKLGRWDILGGETITGSMKKGKIDEATQTSNAIKIQLTRYSTELEDLKGDSKNNISTKSLKTLLDYFFENIFADFFVNSNLQIALSNANDLLTTIENMQVDLKDQKNQCAKDIDLFSKRVENKLVNIY